MKIALITGASSGFGRSIAKILDLNGYNVILLARREQNLLNLQQELKNKSLIFDIDVRDKNSVFNLAENLPVQWKNIEILVNNAGLALGQDDFNLACLDDLECMIDTNIKGVIYITKAFLPFMTKNGIIFNIGSVAGMWPYKGSHVYGASKAFIKQFSLNLRNDLQGSGIRVTTIAPGIAKTEFSQVRFKGDIQKANSVYENTQFLTSDDIAEVIINCIKLPKSVNINYLEIMPTTQTWAGFSFEKNK